MKAHGEQQVLAGMLDIDLYMHNAVADAAADAAADILTDVLEYEAEEKWAAVAYLVGRRLAVVEAEVRAAAPSSTWVCLPTPPPPTPPRDFRAEAARQGHRIRRTGRFLRCVVCQTWRRSLASFAQRQCLARHRVQADMQQPEKEEDSNVDGDQPWQLLTHSQRKRKLEQIRTEARQAKVQRLAAEAEHNEKATAEVKVDLDSDTDLELIDPPIMLPFYIDASHRILAGGGFVACLRCGAMASSATARNVALPAPCLGQAACSTANRSRLRRFQDGDHPRPDRPQWPDGSPMGKLSRRPQLYPGIRPDRDRGTTELHLHV